MPKLHEIHVKNFKAITDLNLLKLARVNYLVGPNGCGKSSLFEALAIPSIFTKRNTSGTIGLNTYGDLARTIREGFGVKVILERDDGANIVNDVSLSVANHGEVEGRHQMFKRTYEDPARAEDNGPNSQDWVAHILDANASPDEQNEGLKVQYPFDLNNIANAETVRDFLNKHYARDEEHVRNIFRSPTESAAIELEITRKDDKAHTLRHESIKTVSYGYQQLLGIYFSIKARLEEYVRNAGEKVVVVCIEEPGVGLHPGLQKKIPELFAAMLEDPALQNVMLLVTTHSSFIVSAACDQAEQKTYLVKGGSTVNLAGDVDRTNEGYDSQRCLSVAAKMLDAGFDDLSSAPSTKETMTIVYCEGASKKLKDSDLYSKIFEDEKDRFVFVSTGGLHEAINAYYAARASVKFVFGEKSVALAFVDRSCSSRDVPTGPDSSIEKTNAHKLQFTDQEREEFLKSDSEKGYRMLRRKEIENYLFDPAVVALLPAAERSVWNVEKLQAEGKEPKDIDYMAGEVKDYLSATANRMAMARLIVENKGAATKAVYDELFACLVKPE